jgi:hypothetical protein
MVIANRLGGREWCGAVALVAGVMLFLVCSSPHGWVNVVSAVAGADSVLSLLVVRLGVAAVVAIARRGSGTVRAVLLAGGAGTLFGVQDGLTRSVVVDGLSKLVMSRTTSWTTHVLVAVAIVGLMLMESAFEAAPLRVALPVITAVVPVTGISYGIKVFGEHIWAATGWVTAEVAGLVRGIALLARGATLTVQPGTGLR